MTAPVRIKLSRAKGFKLQAASLALNGLPAVNVARPGPWGNPFVVGRDGTRAECVHLFKMLTGGMIAITAKATIDEQRAFTRHAADHWKSLKGRNVACWCAADAACHGDVLLALANPVQCREVA